MIIFINKKTLIMVSVLSFAAVYVIFFYLFIPAFKQNRLLTGQIQDKRMDLNRKQVPFLSIRDLEKETSKLQDELKRLNQRLIWEADSTMFLNEITKLASDLEIDFVSFKPESAKTILNRDTGKEKKDPADIALAQKIILVNLKSNYADLIRFLKRIEGADKFMKIDSLSVDSEQNSISKHNIKLALSIFN